MPNRHLDATGLKCPLPVLKARKVLKSLEGGDILEMTATDPGSPGDMMAFCDSSGHELITNIQREGIYHFKIRKK